MSLVFNMQSRLVIVFLPRSKCLLISRLQSPSAVILEPKKIKSVTVIIVSPSFCMKWWAQNQGKLEVVKQEMTRVNIDILGISELRWTGMGEFNSDDHYIYYCGQESLRKNGVSIIVIKSPKCSTWMQSQKRQNDLCSFPRQTIQYHSNLSLCPDQ